MSQPGPSYHHHPVPPPPPPMTTQMPGPGASSPPRKSPGRSFSLSLKSKGKLPLRTGLHDRRWDLDAVPFRPPPSSSDSNSLRRTMSSEDSISVQTLSLTTSPPPMPPPKDPIPQRPPDRHSKVIRDVRMKMSSQDQEAMRKLRLTMDIGMGMANSTSDSGSSSGSLQSPMRVGSSSSLGHGSGQGQGHGRPGLGSRRSTLSRQITSEDLDDPIPASVSLSQPEGYGRTDYQNVSDTNTHTNTDIDTSTEPEPDLIVAVIGHRKVGKSTIIKRATKAWGLTEPVYTTTNEGYTSMSNFLNTPSGFKREKADRYLSDINILSSDTRG